MACFRRPSNFPEGGEEPYTRSSTSTLNSETRHDSYLENGSNGSSETSTSSKKLSVRFPFQIGSFRLTTPKLSKRSNSKKGKRASKYKVKYQHVFGEEDGAYKNCSIPRGKFFVFNFETFDEAEYRTRTGSKEDYDNIIDVLIQMGYGTPRTMSEYCMSGHITKDMFMKKITKFSKMKDHEASDSCIIVIMTHGYDEKTIVTSDCKLIKLDDIYNLFENSETPYLEGKPKLFILQYCRQTKLCDEDDLLEVKSNEELRKEIQRLSQQLLDLKQGKEIIDIEEIEGRVRSKTHGSFPTHNKTEQRGRPKSMIAYLHTEITDQETLDQSPSLVTNNTIDTKSQELVDDVFGTCTVDGSKYDNNRHKKTPTDENDAQNSKASIQNSNISKDNTAVENTENIESVVNTSGYEEDGVKITDCLNCSQSNYSMQRLSDIYIIFSTSAGDPALIDPKKGSLLIQAVCHIFCEYAYQLHIEDLARKTSNYVKEVLQKNDPSHVRRQTAERLNKGCDKMFYLNPIKINLNRQKTI